MTCRLGEQLAEELIEQYKAEHNGECPPKVTINLWAVECIRNEGTMEAQALSLLGVRPVYNASNQVIGLELIPQHELTSESRCRFCSIGIIQGYFSRIDGSAG